MTDDTFFLEALKWLQALAVGVLGAVGSYLSGVSTGGKPWVFGVGVAALVRAVGWAVSKLSPPPPVVPPKEGI